MSITPITMEEVSDKIFQRGRLANDRRPNHENKTLRIVGWRLPISFPQ